MDDLTEKCRQIRMLITDVDSVLTDGKIIYDGEGRELKEFHVHDGSAAVFLSLSGIVTAVISGRDSVSLRKRIDDMNIRYYRVGRHDKLTAYEEIKRESGIRDEAIAYIGDDLLDIPVLKRVALPVTVPEGRPEIKKLCLYTTKAGAGKGAFREVAEMILKAQDKWSGIISRYSK